MPFAIPQLDILLIGLVALAVCLLVVAFAKAFFGVAGTLLGKLPVVGGWLDATAHRIEQRITNTFGGFALKVEGVIGASWHGLARIVDRIGHDLAAHAGLLATIAQFIPGVGLLSGLYRLVQDARYLIGRLAHAIVGIGHDLGTRVKVIERGIGADVLPRIRHLEHEVTHTIEHDIASLRARDKALAREYDHLYRWMRSHPWTIVTDAFVGAVAIALARLGLSWIRCPSLGRLGKRFGCAPWTLLEDLLAASLTAFAVADLCTFANVAMDTAVLIRPALLGLVDVEDALIGCHGAEGVPKLEPLYFRPPPSSRNLPLAA